MHDFIRQALLTESPARPQLSGILTRLLHAGIGMTTESAEFMDALKKRLFYNQELDHTNLLEELGDMLWYIALALSVLDSDFDKEMDRVIRKLRVRFPDKFTDYDATYRNLAAERTELER